MTNTKAAPKRPARLWPLIILFLATLIAGGYLVAGWDRGQLGNSSPQSVATPSDPTLSEITFFEARIARDPTDFVSMNRLAAAYVQRGRETADISYYGIAEAVLRDSLAVLPDPNFAAVVQLASVLNTHHRFDDALPLAQQAVDMRPGDAFAHAVLGDAAIELGQTDEATTAFRVALDVAPGVATYGRMARLALTLEGPAAALAWWQRALATAAEANPERLAWVNVQIGHAHLWNGDVEIAREHFSTAAGVLPGFIHAVAGLGMAESAAGDHAAAIEFLEQALKTVQPPEYVIQLGDAHAAAGHDANARAAYERVPALYARYEANGINTDLQMAQFLADHGDPVEAIAKGRKAWEVRHDVEAAVALAWALHSAGRSEEAMELVREAERLGAIAHPMLVTLRANIKPGAERV